MNFNTHSRLEGTHAFLSPSNYHWVNYDEEKLTANFLKAQAAQRGTELHALACQLIKMGVKLPKTNKTLNMYVNDAIGFQMQPEQILYYSDNCYGCADTINFKKNLLRIHDYKSGESPASMKQLIIYEALFCLEYGFNPSGIDAELRIYQFDEFTALVPDPNEVSYVMEKIIRSDKRIEQLKIGG